MQAPRHPALAGAGPHHLGCFKAGVAIVLGDPMGQVPLIFMKQIGAAESDRSRDHHVFVNRAAFVACRTAPKQAQVPARIPSAMAYGTAVKDEQAVEIEALAVAAVGGDQAENFIAQGRANALVGVQDQNPVGFDRQIIERPVLLLGRPRSSCCTTRAPAARAISQVRSVLKESTTKISSTHPRKLARQS